MNNEQLKAFSLLVEFDEQDRADLADLLKPLSLTEGESLFVQHDEADTLYLISQGSIRIKSEGCGDLGLLCAGAAVGAISLMTIGAREASAVAQSDCELLVLTRAGFRRLAAGALGRDCQNIPGRS